jgi:hypothetical protein
VQWEPVALTAPEQPPDIYYLVFDRYADQPTLANEFAHDNGPFLASLERRGFHVARESHTNYPKTELAMSAALNMRMLDETVWPKFRYRELLSSHRVGRLLKAHGYRYHHFGNLHNGLRSNRDADVCHRFSVMPTELADNLFRMTPLWPLLPETDLGTRETEKFDAIAALAGDDGPKFVYAHFLLPHEPWKFDRDGRRLTPAEAARRTERENYVAQLIYTNTRIEALVERILADSPRPPIIVIQADEGPELRYEGDQQLPRIAQIRKRCGIISAFHLPGKNAFQIVPPAVTPVNTFRLIFREYFGAELELLDDRTFYFEPANRFGKPELTTDCRFVDVTDELLRREAHIGH